MECVIETKAGMNLQFIDGLRGDRFLRSPAMPALARLILRAHNKFVLRLADISKRVGAGRRLGVAAWYLCLIPASGCR